MELKGGNMEIDNRVSGKTRLLGIIGNPLEQSISPQLHNTISKHLCVDTIYVPYKVEKCDLELAVKGLKAINVAGFNVTIPYKKEIMKYIDENTKEALLMGAVNTVKNIDGRFYGYNTDAEGFSKSFKEEAGMGFKDKKVVIIGAGGTARAIAVKIAIESAAKIYIVNRTVSKANDISEVVNNNISRIAEAYSYDDKRIKEIFNGSDIVINATSVGMYPDIESSPIGKFTYFTGNQVVYDVIYNPGKTKFLTGAGKKGCKVINGLGMLFYQGIYAYEIWTGIKLSDEIKKEIFSSFVTIIKK